MKTKSLKIGSLLIVFLSWAGTANAQEEPPYECDDNFGECGTPQQSGGGGGGGGGSILINNTDLGDTYQHADDYDDDGHEDPYDNCPFVSNRDQANNDGDTVGSSCDNCPSDDNEDQKDIDGDGIGDACDSDRDGDSVENSEDNCPDNPNPLINGEQKDTDGDGDGDACDDDMDNDGRVNQEDNCPLVYNPDQADEDPDKWGDACDDDDDGDGIRNIKDNCTLVANNDQEDTDGDQIGDACDPDKDGDGVVNLSDNCQNIPNADQIDLDRDGKGDICDDMFCYVVMGDIPNCLNPDDAFTIYSPDIVAETGEDIRLRLFANRINQPVRYTWVVKDAPSGSRATVENAVGAASISPSYEYHYLKDSRVIFSPDKPGTYEIHVVAELVWEDEVTGTTGARAEATAFLEISGKAITTQACSTAPVGFGRTGFLQAILPVMLLGLGLLLMRRR